MVMDRRHAKNPLPAQLERTNLQDHRDGLDDKNSADKEQQDFLFDDYRDRAESSAKRQRPYVTHENFCGMCVVPKKAERGPDQCAAKNCELADARDVADI